MGIAKIANVIVLIHQITAEIPGLDEKAISLLVI